MRIMGFPNCLHWLSWFVKSFIIFLAVGLVVFLTIKIKWGSEALFNFIKSSVLLTFLILYNSSLITLGFLISAMLPSGN